MNNRDIEWRKIKLEQIREQLESGQLNAVRELLPDKVIEKACEDCQYYFRTRLLSPLVVIFHMISAGISREGSFQSAWHLSGQKGQSGSLAKARRRLPLKVWKSIDEWMMGQVEGESGPEERWRGHRMIGIDGTCVSMSDEPEFFSHFGRRWGRFGFARYPLARVVVAVNLKTMMMVGHEVGGYTTGEKTLLTRHLPAFQRGDILVLDRLYAGANRYVEYKRAGVEFISRIHQQLQIEKLKVVQILSKADWLVEMPINASHRRKDPSLPENVRVRILQTEAKVRGQREKFWMVTSLLDAARYPGDEIRAWYKKRWKVEGLIGELKVWLGADVLRSKSVEGIYKELYARVIGLNLIHWLMLKASREHAQPLERISTTAALRLTAAYSLKMSTAPGWRLPELYQTLLYAIALSRNPYRPGRNEPRMIRRDTKHYPMLKITRTEWKRINAVAA